MLQNGEISPIAVKRAVHRYWWIPVLSSIFCGCLALAAIKILPKKYTSKTTVMVEQPQVPIRYVESIVSDDVNHRVASLQGEILSKSNLVPVIDKFGLYPKERGKASTDELAGELRSAVKITPLEATPGMEGRGPLPGFYVSVTFNDPYLAQQICSEITSMFLEENRKKRIGIGLKTTEFLGSELEDAKKRLDAEDEKLAEFQKMHLGSSPDDSAGNLNMLTTLNTQLEATAQSASRAQQDKTLNESLLQNLIETWKGTTTGVRSTDSLEQQLATLQEQRDVMLTKYTPQHPDVVKLDIQISDLKRKIADAAKAPPAAQPTTTASTHEPFQIQQLRAKIHQDDLQIAELTHRENQIQDDIRKTEGRVQASPMVELQLKELTRNYQTALEFYKETLKKRENATMATNLEQDQESEQFTQLDKANLPTTPSFPDAVKFRLGGFGGGLALGLAFLGFVVYSDKCLYTERNVETNLKLPVLASIPSFQVSHGTGR